MIISAVPGSPQNVVIDVLSSTAVVIKWEPPKLIERNGIITGYNLTVTIAGIISPKQYSVSANVLSITIDGRINFLNCVKSSIFTFC